MVPTLGAWLRDYPWKSAYGPADRPLEAFYLPALTCAIRYDRIAGFFSSYALAVAAQGVARLIARGGRMRLLVGAQLSPQDVEAILGGITLQDRLAEPVLVLLRDPEALADALLRERLKVLAWLVANDRLEIRVVVESDPVTRQPLASGGYFHAKGGILWDEHGDGIAFSGSINETATAWRSNYERFHVFCSWREAEHFQQEAETFERLWRDAEAGWLTVPLPQAVHQELVRLAPPEPPIEEPALTPVAHADTRARWVAQFLRDAPFLVHRGWRVGAETAPVQPFPHQRAVAYGVLDQFPCRRLLADEVGLGKTIEAGLIIRSLLLSGRAKRCLILAPRSLAKQWQEELRDRFLVTAPFFDGARFVYFGHPENSFEAVPEGKSPWEVHPVVIASAQMVKRKERAEALLSAPPWDLVVVDEAHHARRRDFLDLNRYRPNRLLALLEQLRERTRGLLLLTATPMQVHPLEVWDLFRVLGLPGRWQRDQNAFLTYFQQLRQPYEEIAWDLVLPLLRESVTALGWDAAWREQARRALGPVRFHSLQATIERGSRRDAMQLQPEERRWLVDALHRHNPVARLMYRHTRPLLREYHRRGLLQHPIARRNPEPVWLDMTDPERQLYRAMERYISEYYQRYEEVRRGLGFIMTVYRRRLTSSLYALQQSLTRRKQYLMGLWTDRDRPAGLDDEDIEEADLERDEVEDIGDRPGWWQDEVRELDKLLEDVERLGVESKLAALREHLDGALARWDQVLVFTQYTDTLDFLRQELLPTFGARLGCYSGRGGEVWNPSRQAWEGMSKERIQRLFAEGHIKVLLCTEAAGEGLNLQNCGVLFNYDMPWNPMKVEQRIGRIDRIGQRRPEVFIRHYFYRGTVEAEVYRALGDRIGWFETVVGELQPILQRAASAIERAALATEDQRKAVLEEELKALERAWDTRQEGASPVAEWQPLADPSGPTAPVTLEDLEGVLSKSLVWSDGGPEPAGEGLYHLRLEGLTTHVTTRPDVLDQPQELETAITFWSYGAKEFDASLRVPPPPSEPGLIRLHGTGTSQRVGFYGWRRGRWEAIQSLDELVRSLDATEQADPGSASEAQEQFRRDCDALGK